ncbi:MAG: protease pro-enzyme activation domain-containing protein, partial [Thermoleophilia bacterium]
MKTLAIALALALPSLAVAGTTPEPPLRVAVGLTRDTAGLEAFAIAVSNPAGRAYGRYASIGALAAQFGATPATVRAVRAELR